MNRTGIKDRPWGQYNTIIHQEDHFVRYLFFRPNEELSVSKHEHRDEHWVILKGCALITIDDEEKMLFPGEGITVPLGAIHHILNPSNCQELVIIELAYGKKACNSDIIRISDKYGRTNCKEDVLNQC
jgi:mannose-6-phosphate isomerase-like protein (cupin superfamily)